MVPDHTQPQPAPTLESNWVLREYLPGTPDNTTDNIALSEAEPPDCVRHTFLTLVAQGHYVPTEDGVLQLTALGHYADGEDGGLTPWQLTIFAAASDAAAEGAQQ